MQRLQRTAPCAAAEPERYADKEVLEETLRRMDEGD